jgi:hypothetical protein
MLNSIRNCGASSASRGPTSAIAKLKNPKKTLKRSYLHAPFSSALLQTTREKFTSVVNVQNTTVAWYDQQRCLENNPCYSWACCVQGFAHFAVFCRASCVQTWDLTFKRGGISRHLTRPVSPMIISCVRMILFPPYLISCMCLCVFAATNLYDSKSARHRQPNHSTNYCIRCRVYSALVPCLKILKTAVTLRKGKGAPLVSCSSKKGNKGGRRGGDKRTNPRLERR